MLKAVEAINPTKKRLKIEIPSDAIEKEIQNSLEKLRQRTKIPGFRPGKAPINLIEKRFGRDVESEVLEKVIPEFYTKALKEAELKPVARPVFEERLDFKRSNPLSMTLTVEVRPEIDNLNYEGIKVKDIHVDVDEADVENTLKSLQEEKATLEVSEKEVGIDDLVNFDFVDYDIIGGEKTPDAKEQILKIGNELLPKDLYEKLIGKRKGEEVKFTTTLPEDFESKEIAGRTVEIRVVITEVKEKKLPAIDDEFAKDLGADNLNALKEKVREGILRVKKEQTAKAQKAELIEKLVESHNFEVPETLLEMEMSSLVTEARMARQESEEDDESLLSEMKHRALRNVKASILLDVIGDKEGVTVTEDEVKNRIIFMAQRLSATPEAIINLYVSRDGSLEGLRNSIREDKVMDILLSKAVLEKGE